MSGGVRMEQEARPSREAVGISASGQRWGDLLLAFPACRHVSVSRHGLAWSALGGTAEWSLLGTAGQPGVWCGYPLTTWRTGSWGYWLLGELAEPGPKPEDRMRLGAGPVGGPEPPLSLNGHCAMLGWDSLERRWHAWTNRFGTLHLYHARDGDRAALGTFFPSVAQVASRRKLDWQGLAGFFGFGFFPQDRTYFEDVRVLRPASHYLFDERGRLLSQERYWQWHHEPHRTRSYEDTVAQFAETFHAVMADLTREGRVAIPVSGGLDSRSTVAALDADAFASGRFWSYSYGYTGSSVETRIAQEVARRKGLPFDSFVVGPYLFEQLGQVLDSVEGFQDVTQCRQASVVEPLADHADTLVAAHWGDVWLDDMGLVSEDGASPGEDAVLDHALHKMVKRGREWLLRELCAPRLGGESPEALLRDTVQAELRRLPPIEDPDFRVKALKTDQWSFRWTLASIRMFQPAALPRLPFYDTRLADLLCTVPSAWVRGRQLQIDYLKRYAPDLASVTWQPYEADLYHYQRRSALRPVRRGLQKAWRLLRRERPLQRNWEVQLLGAGGRQGLEKWLLRPGLKLHELVAPAAVRSLVEGFHGSPQAGNGYTVSMLLTFSAMLERYG